MKRIKLTRGLYAKVDAEWFDALSEYRWCAKKNGPGRFYACRGVYSSETGKVRLILMHRVIMGLVGKSSKIECDHVNMDGLDNRQVNLRIATHQQNMRNRRSHRGSSSRFRGVFWDSQKRKWGAQLIVDGKKVIRVFSHDERACAREYDRAVSILNCQFARKNSKGATCSR